MPNNPNALPGYLQNILNHAGIVLNGPRPEDVHLHDARAINRVLAEGRLGLGEAYIDGWWDCEALDVFFARMIEAGMRKSVNKWSLIIPAVMARLVNRQRGACAWRVGERHYDLGNDVFQAMLDPRMTYTCGYWARAQNLAQAQEDKLELVCRKLQLEHGMHVLDIGCGWGSFAKYAAERHGVRVTGVTISREQIALGSEMCAGLPIELRLQDYREVTGKFDRVVSLGMFEHVGHKNYGRFMQIARERLDDPRGLFLLHTIGGFRKATHTDPWFDKYIFPGAVLPSIQQVAAAVEGMFIMEDWQNFGPDYDHTLQAWWRNFDAAWPLLREKYGERFYRIWRYYLHFSMATFRTRRNNLWQIVLSPAGLQKTYRRPDLPPLGEQAPRLQE